MDEEISDCHEFQYVSDLCSTGWCAKTEIFSSKGKCVDAPVSNHKPPLSCKSEYACLGAAKGAIYDGSCTCGFNPTGESYCTPFLGDTEGQNYINALKAWA
jgi:hypothetical protein